MKKREHFTIVDFILVILLGLVLLIASYAGGHAQEMPPACVVDRGIVQCNYTYLPIGVVP